MARFRQTFFRLDAGFLVVLLICLLAIWPFISRPSLPQETDAELHIYRLAELSYLIRAGEFYPRWAPHFYFGYGYPIFNYYAPLSYYAGLLFDFLPGVGAVGGVKGVFVLGLLLAGLGMYGFARDNWGRTAGYVAAAVYVYAPYIQYVDPHARGDLAEAFSFAFFPLALWALDRFRRRPSRRNWLASVLLVAAVILAHNLMAMVFFGLLLAWVAWQTLNGQWPAADGRAPTHLSGLIWPFLPLLLGVGLAAFFWLPVALEQKAVNLETLIGDGGHFDFRNHFLSWPALLGFSPWLDWGATEPEFALNLGLAQWLWGGLGLLALAAYGVGRPPRQLPQARHLAYFALTAIFLIWLMLPSSTIVWEMIPLMPYMQFPWRLLGAAVAMLAVLAGAAAWLLEALLGPARRGWAAALLVGLTLLPALPMTQVPPWESDFGDVRPPRVVWEELTGRWLGTTSTADFLPATVVALPHPEGSLLEQLLAGQPPDRVNRATLPVGARVAAESLRPLHTRYHVSSEEDFLLRLFLFDFPGWTARVNGEVVETELGMPEGFLVIPVPAGEHQVDVRFEDTGPRRLAWGITLLSLLATLLAGWRLKKGEGDWDGPALPAAWSESGPLVGAVVLITALHLLLLDPAGWLRYESSGFVAEPAQIHSFANFDEQIALIGYDLPGRPAAGAAVDVTLYWKALQPVPINYQVFLHLLDGEGRVVAQSDKLNPGEFPTRRWPLDQYVRDHHRLHLPDALPPGDYYLSAGLWVAAEGWRLPLLDDDGRQIGDNYRLSLPLTIR